MTLIDDIRVFADRHGARIGVTDLAPFREVEHAITEQVASGRSASLGFTFREPHRASVPAESFPWGRSIIVAAVPYLGHGDGPSAGGDDRSVARFADGDRYRHVSALLSEIVGLLEARGWLAEAVHDDDRIVDRAVAVRSGVAWWGKSTMALTPGLGPWFLIGSVVTDAIIDATEPMRRGCGTCDACIPACPTGAIVAPGVLDARRCLAAILQSRGAIPLDLRRAVGGRVYGCDDCLTACPPGVSALEGHLALPGTHPRTFLQMSDRELAAVVRHWFVPGRQLRFVRRNALVALGNVGEASDVHVAAAYASHPDPLLAEHATWALEHLPGPMAAAAAHAAMSQAQTQ